MGDENAVLGDWKMSQSGASESGWTAYFEQQHQQQQSVPKRLTLSSSGRPQEETYSATLVQEFREDDPSMASDASSGPESARREHCKRKAEKMARPVCGYGRQEDDLDDTCQSNLSCESVSDDPKPRQFFKRRKEVSDHQVGLELEIGDGHSDENDVELEPGEAEISSRPPVIEEQIPRNAVNSRLEVLQHLIPNSRELDEEEVLEVAIDYVKSLEEKIKMFEAAGISNAFFAAPAASTITSRSCSTALQDRGWCLMPISVASTKAATSFC